MVKLADYVINFLENIGVESIFTVTGGGSIFLDDALGRSKKIKYYCCHHEQAVAMSSEAYARTKESIGVSLVTSGPGGTNTITGVAGSWIDSVPHLVLSGQVFYNQTIRNTGVRQLGVQEINIIDLVKPITKYAVMITDATKIKYHLQKAIYLAKTGRPGPVWLDIPANVQNAEIDENSLEEFNPDELQLNYGSDLKQKVSQVVELLKSAKKPLIHAGYGIRIAKAINEFMHFVEKNNLPFVTARNGNDIVDTDYPLFIGRPGTFAQRGSNFAVQNADVYLAIGTRLSLPQTGYNSKDYARKAIKIMVDIDKTELEKDTLNLNLKIHADALEFLQELNRQLATLPGGTALGTNEWVVQCQKWKEKYPVVLSEYKEQQDSVNSYYFTDVLSGLLAPEDIIVTDMGFSFQCTHQAFRVKKGQRLFTNCGMASMGWGLPAAIGACIANNKKRTICISGEGGLQMNIQELATIMHYHLPVKLFVYNNGGYLTLKQTLEYGFKGRLMGCNQESGLSFPNYQKIADAHGIKYMKLSNHNHLADRIKEAVDCSGPVFCEILMDPNQVQAPRFLARKTAGGVTIPTPFEDLYPHLNQEEIEENVNIK